MIDLRKQVLRHSTILLVATGLLYGCSDSPNEQTGTADANPENKTMDVAFAYVGPVGDGGWSFAHNRARLELEKAFPDQITTRYVESVPEGADAERVLRDMAANGAKLVFATSFGFMEPTLRVAQDFPEVKFEHATGYKTSANMRSYDARTYEGAYLAGVVAGAMTQSKVLGVVASVPIPEVIRNINSFTLGAQLSNPDIKTEVVWVNEWFNPSKETEAATALINNGADVLIQNTDSSAVLQTTEKLGKRGFGWNSDMHTYGPNAHLGSVVINWSPYYIKAVNDVLEGNWSSVRNWWGVKEGTIDLQSLSDDIPQLVRDQLEQIKAGIKDGSHIIWKGPIDDNNGRPILPPNGVADDAFLTGIDFYVKGVVGSVPGTPK